VGVFVVLGFGFWARPPTPKPQTPNPQSPIPNVFGFKNINNFKLLQNNHKILINKFTN